VLDAADGLDDKAVVGRVVEKAATLARRAQLGENVLARERHEIVCRVDLELFPYGSEDPGGVVLEFEVVP